MTAAHGFRLLIWRLDLSFTVRTLACVTGNKVCVRERKATELNHSFIFLSLTVVSAAECESAVPVRSRGLSTASRGLRRDRDPTAPCRTAHRTSRTRSTASSMVATQELSDDADGATTRRDTTEATPRTAAHTPHGRRATSTRTILAHKQPGPHNYMCTWCFGH